MVCLHDERKKVEFFLLWGFFFRAGLARGAGLWDLGNRGVTGGMFGSEESYEHDKYNFIMHLLGMR